MAQLVLASGLGTRAVREPLFDVHPQTGATIEVFYADRTMETFGRCGAGWFWWRRRRGFAPDSKATGPFASRYAAYRHAMTTASARTRNQLKTHNVNADTVRTHRFFAFVGIV